MSLYGRDLYQLETDRVETRALMLPGEYSLVTVWNNIEGELCSIDGPLSDRAAVRASLGQAPDCFVGRIASSLR